MQGAVTAGEGELIEILLAEDSPSDAMMTHALMTKEIPGAEPIAHR